MTNSGLVFGDISKMKFVKKIEFFSKSMTDARLKKFLSTKKRLVESEEYERSKERILEYVRITYEGRMPQKKYEAILKREVKDARKRFLIKYLIPKLLDGKFFDDRNIPDELDKKKNKKIYQYRMQEK